MSYARLGWDSDVYVIGTQRGDVNVIECLGCKLHSDLRKAQTPDELEAVGAGDLCGVPYAEMVWDFGEPQVFTTGSAAVQHMIRHMAEGHKVPPHCLERMHEDDWVPWEAEDEQSSPA